MAKNAVAVAEKSAPLAVISEINYEQFAGMGLEDIKATDLSIPFLRILAQLSPQVNKRDGAYVQGAEAGDIYHTVSSTVFKGDVGVRVVPCYMSNRLVEWKPREKGGGYVQSYNGEDPIAKLARRDDRGTLILPNGNTLVNTLQFFVLLLTEEGPQRCIIAMSGSQVTTGKKWNTTIKSQTGRRADGSLYEMAIFSNVYQLTSAPQQNDKGSWFGWKILREGLVADREILVMGAEFSKAIRAGEITVKEDEGNDHPSNRDSSSSRADEIL
jgi:hypothetical protein